jgi:hypothetical protein
VSHQTAEHIEEARRHIAAVQAKLDRIEADTNVTPVKLTPTPPKSGYTFGGAPVNSRVIRDPLRLLTPFADKVEALFATLRGRGFSPFCWETYRTHERAMELTKKGTGILQSMHCYGIAVDVVDSDDTPWKAPPEFWEALRTEAEGLGLTTLYRKGRPFDRPHVQAIPVKDQHRFRGMMPDEQLAFVTELLG